MIRFACFLVLLLNGSSLFSKEILNESESKLITIDRLLYQGNYNESMAEAQRYLSWYSNQSGLPKHDWVHAQLAILKSKREILDFDDVQVQENQLFLSIDSIQKPAEKALALLQVVQYLNQFENYKQATVTLADPSLRFDDPAQIRYWNLELEKIASAIGLGDLLAAEQKIQKVNLQLLTFQKQIPIKQSKIERLSNPYFQLIFQFNLLKADLLLKNGDWQQAEKELLSTRIWIQKTVGKNGIAYAVVQQKLAHIYYEKQDHKAYRKALESSYHHANVSDNHRFKVLQWLSITCLNESEGRLIAVQQNIRRLEIHAHSSLYRNNYFQLALNIAETKQLIEQGLYSKAEQKLNKYFNAKLQLPLNHPLHNLAIQMRLELAKQRANRVLEQACIDTLLKSDSLYKGVESADYQWRLLKRLQFQIQAGTNVAAAEKIVFNLKMNYLGKKVSTESQYAEQIHKSLIEIFLQTNRYNKAYEQVQTLYDIQKKLYGEQSWPLLFTQVQWSTLAWYHSKYNESAELFRQIMQQQNTVHRFSRATQIALYTQLSTLTAMAGDGENEKLFGLKAYKLLRKEQNQNWLIYTETKEKVGLLYFKLYQYALAEKLIQSSIQLKSTALGPEHPSLISGYLALAELYIQTGNFSQAENHISKAIQLSKTIYGENAFKYAEALYVKATFATTIGDDETALELLQQAKQIETQIFDAKHIKIAFIDLLILKTKAKLKPGELPLQAYAYFDIGKQIIQNVGRSNVFFIQYLVEKAAYKTELKSYDSAFVALREAEIFWKNSKEDNFLQLATIYNQYGALFSLQHMYIDAEKNYIKSRKIYETVFSAEHPQYANATAKMAKANYMLTNKEKALELMETCIPLYLQYLEKYFPSLSFQEKSKFWQQMKEEFEFYYFLSLKVFKGSKPKLNAQVYNAIMATKALLLASDIKLRNQVAASNDTILMQQFEAWQVQKELLTSMFSMSKAQMAEQGLDIRSTNEKITQLERQMSQRSALFASAGNKTAPTYQQVLAQLEPKEYAIEMLRFRIYNHEFTDSIQYAALILSKANGNSTTPRVVLLDQGNAMEQKYLKYYKNVVIQDLPDAFCYDVFWRAIKKEIPDGSRIYWSADGVYNQLNIEMFYNNEKQKYVLDENQIVYLTNTRDLIQQKEKTRFAFLRNWFTKHQKAETKASTQSILCGNPDFYVTANAGNIQSLEGAEQEVKALATQFDLAKRKYTLLMNAEVTEEYVKKIKDPKVLHIATHGFFKETEAAKANDFVSNPLLNSGLLLSGAGDILDNKKVNYVNAAAGVLTAYEVVNMELDRSELVVLSACETGKGQVQAGEGVYGLQRSFLIAGAKSVVISLFKVNDEITKELMEEFYKLWLAGKDKRTAFDTAKRNIRAKYPSPIFWGSFIMIEGKIEPTNTQP